MGSRGADFKMHLNAYLDDAESSDNQFIKSKYVGQ